MYSYTWALFSRALVGIQPQFKQIPPRLSFSMIAVLKPNCDARIAATYPPGPLPRTTTSYAISIYDFRFYDFSDSSGSILLLTSLLPSLIKTCEATRK